MCGSSHQHHRRFTLFVVWHPRKRPSSHVVRQQRMLPRSCLFTRDASSLKRLAYIARRVRSFRSSKHDASSLFRISKVSQTRPTFSPNTTLANQTTHSLHFSDLQQRCCLKPRTCIAASAQRRKGGRGGEVFSIVIRDGFICYVPFPH